MVILAGSNGTGKSSVLEAIICFKENIGPYHRYTQTGGLVNVDAEFAEIAISFKIFPEEKEYLKSIHKIEVPNDILEGSFKIRKDRTLFDQKVSRGLQLMLKAYRVEKFPNIGTFDYFNPNRFMAKKDIVNIALGGFKDQTEKNKRVTFSPTEKFNMTKEFLAQGKLSDLQYISDKVEYQKLKVGPDDMPDSLAKIKEVFNHLLSPKKFKGVDISISPVRFIIETPGGDVDIDDLSSGEKEILFSYTELVKLNPNSSIILYDEPDLHLNQKVTRELVPTLRNIGENNQFWLTTHSFGVMGSVKYNELFRLENYSGKNQITNAFSDEERYNLFRSVAGEIGIVTLGERIVFVEGTERTDTAILESFFDEYKGRIAFIPSDSVQQVIGVHTKILELLNTSSQFNFYFAIRDRDFMDSTERKQSMEKGNQRLYVWERYHIENYLLDFESIYEVLNRNFTPCPVSSPKDVEDKMLEIIKTEHERFISHMIKYEVNKNMGRIYFDIGFSDFEKQALEKAKKLKENSLKIFEEANIKDIISRKKKEFEEACKSGEWVKIIPARELMKIFIGKYGTGLRYEQFKNQIVNEIKTTRRIPSELTTTINKILTTK